MNVGQPEGSFAVSKISHAPIHPKYRADIDGLRAIAVLAVVGFHAFPSFIRGGFVGVDVFFVISGFLISSIIFGSLDRASFSFAEFYGRRIRRIFPALITVLLVTLLAGWFLLFVDEYSQLGKHAAAGAGFVSNPFFGGERLFRQLCRNQTTVASVVFRNRGTVLHRVADPALGFSQGTAEFPVDTGRGGLRLVPVEHHRG